MSSSIKPGEALATTSGICAAHLGKRARLPQHSPHSGHAAAALVAAHGLPLCSGWFPLQQEGVWQVRGRWRRGSGSGGRQEPRCRLRPARIGRLRYMHASQHAGQPASSPTSGSGPRACAGPRAPADRREACRSKAYNWGQSCQRARGCRGRGAAKGEACAGQTGWGRSDRSPTPEPMIGLLQRHGGLHLMLPAAARFGFMREGRYFRRWARPICCTHRL